MSKNPKQPDDDEELIPDTDQEDTPDREPASQKVGNSHLRRLMDRNFLEYASYVIKDRAIPVVTDGLKPVQRRILWSLRRIDDGKYHKVANVIGHSMQFHPHGDASIYEALVVLANKEYFIEKQGNFGNIMTGDRASAARYIECRLTPLAREVLFNNDITEFTDSYDGRNREPVVLPAKVPALLMLGAEGIAVGMSTKILPHNFREIIQAQIAVLRKEPFALYPDFQTGGIMDASNYEDGNGKVQVRARIDIQKRRLIIREVPYGVTTERLINSIENAARRNKIKISAINDYTAENVEIEITPARGYDPQKALKAIYAYTDCSVSISTNLMAINDDDKPAQFSVSDVVHHNTEKLIEYLRREQEIELGRLNEAFHEKTLAQIFIENRIYKRIEECDTYDLVKEEVRKGLNKFKKLLKRAITDEDIEKLLTIQIRRISLFDINKNKDDIDKIVADIEQVEKNLKRIRAFTIKYLEDILEKYGSQWPRKTEIDEFDRIDIRKVALNNIKVGWDRKNCYIGTAVRSEENINCNEFDKLLCIERSGKYRVVNIPDKQFIGRLFYLNKYDKDQVFYIIYSDKKTRKCYAKQTVIDKFITDKEYSLCPKNCKLEIITTKASLYECELSTKRGEPDKITFNCLEAVQRNARARGQLIHARPIAKFSYLGVVEEDPEQREDCPESEESLESEIAQTETAEESKTRQEVSTEKSAEGKPPISKKKIEPEVEPEPTSKSKPEPKAEAAPKKKVRQPKPKSKKETQESKDDWGIEQPEFGF